jgi:hypothetical protein
MSIHLLEKSESAMAPRVLMSYEDGSVTLFARGQDHSMEKTIEGIGWEQIWSCRHHTESGTTYNQIGSDVI